MEKLEPDVCTWQETGLTGNNQMKIKGYHASVRNRKNFKKMGGVATAVKNSINKNAVKIKEGEKDDEYMITRLGHTNPAINIINVYGGIEERMEDQEVIENWGRLKRDLEDIQSRNESVIMLGDFNRAIVSSSSRRSNI